MYALTRGNKMTKLPKKVKIKRIEQQIDVCVHKEAIERRKRAIEYLEKENTPNIGWEKIQEKFGFDYWLFNQNNRKI